MSAAIALAALGHYHFHPNVLKRELIVNHP